MTLDVIVRNIPYLLEAAELTLLLSGGYRSRSSFRDSSLCGTPVVLAYQSFYSCRIYQLFRGVPLLVQLLAAFYLLPQLGVSLPVFATGVLCLGLCTTAYSAEILRGALHAVPYGQMEAAAALGLSPWIIWWRIRWPQALKTALLPLINETILVVKASSLASVIGLAELTRVAQNIAGQTFHYAEIYLTAGLLYLVINSLLAGLGSMTERWTTPFSAGPRYGT